MKRSRPVDDAGVISTDLLDSKTTRTSFEEKFFFFAYSQKIHTPEDFIFTRNASMVFFIEGGFKSPISIATDKTSNI